MTEDESDQTYSIGGDSYAEKIDGVAGDWSSQSEIPAHEELVSKLYAEYIGQDSPDEPLSIEELRRRQKYAEGIGDFNAILNLILEKSISNKIENLDIDLDTIEKQRFATVFTEQIKFSQQTDINDSYSEYVDHIAEDTEPVMNFLLYTRAHGANINEMYDTVSSDNNLQQLLGFSSLPSKPTLYRAKNERFEITEAELSDLAERYVHTAIRGGYEIPEDVKQWLMFRCGDIIQQEQTHPVETRIAVLRTYLRQEILPKILPNIDLQRAHNTKYDVEKFFGFLAEMARKSWSGSSGSKLAEYELDLELPRVQTLNNHINKYNLPDPDQFHHKDSSDIGLLRMFQDANDEILQAGLTSGAAKTNAIAIDTTNWYWYGEKAPWNLGVKPERNTAIAWQFICLSLVGTDSRFVVAVPVNNKEALPKLSESLIKRVQRFVDPQYVYFDKEFYNSKIIKICRDLDINYLIQAKSSDKIDELEKIVRKSDTRGKIKRGIDFAGLQPSPDVLAVQLHEDRVGNDGDQVTSYITDINEVDISQLGPDPVSMHYKFDKRWSIEAAFDSIKNRFLTPTESPATEVRIFYFLAAVLFYNAYRLSKLNFAEPTPEVEEQINHSTLDFLTAVSKECLEKK